MRKSQHNSQIIQRDKHLSVHNVSGTYIAPDIEIIDIEIEQSFLQTGSTPDLPGDGL